MNRLILLSILLIVLLVLLLMWQNRWAKKYIEKNASKYFSETNKTESYTTVRYGIAYMILAAIMCIISATGILGWEYSLGTAIAALIIIVWMGILNRQAIFSETGLLLINCATQEEDGRKIKHKAIEIKWSDIAKVSVLNSRHTYLTLTDGRNIDVKTKRMMGTSVLEFLVSPGSEVGPRIKYYRNKFGKLK